MEETWLCLDVNVYDLWFYVVLQVVMGPAVWCAGDYYVHPDVHYCHLHCPVPKQRFLCYFHPHLPLWDILSK